MSLIIRPAEQPDVPGIARVQVRTWQAAYRGQMPDAYLDGLDAEKRVGVWSKALVDPKTMVLVAVHEGSVVGFGCFVPSRDDDASPDVGEIAALYVDVNYWRSGIGAALVEAILESARERGCRQISLWVLVGNTSARAFYEARGFNTDGHTKTVALSGFSLHEIRYRRCL